MGKFRRTVASFCAGLLFTGGAIVALGSSPSVEAGASTSKSPIVLGLILAETGGDSSSYVNVPDGAQARIDAQNAAGGIDGHPLKLVVEDDQSTTTGTLAASQTLIQDKGAFGILDDSSATFASAAYMQKAGVPVTGSGEDGPEWDQAPNSNMFRVSPALLTPFGGKFYSYNDGEAALKDLGVTKLAQVVANVPSAIDSANGIFAAAKPLGISKCLDDIVPLGDVNFTTFALQMKQDGCNGVEVLSILSTCIGVQSALKQAGLKAADFCATGYDQSVLSQPSALATMQGTYATAAVNVLGNDVSAPAKLLLSRLKKYTSWPGGIPSAELDYAYEAADLMIQGLKAAGPNPTRKAVISDLRKVSSYTAGGLIPAPGLDYTHFGTLAGVAKTQCEVIYQVKGKSYVPALHGKAACGKLVVSSSS